MSDTESTTSTVFTAADKPEDATTPPPEPARRTSLGHRLFDGCVEVAATFVAAVLNHPSVQLAIARGIVAGMKQFTREPDLGEHLRVMGETMTKTQTELARNAGEDFPKVVGNFFKGMMQPRSRTNSTKDDQQISQQLKNHQPALTPPRPDRSPMLPSYTGGKPVKDESSIRLPVLAPHSPLQG